MVFFAGCEHLHRCLVVVDNSLHQNRFSQGIGQCLKLYTGLSIGPVLGEGSLNRLARKFSPADTAASYQRTSPPSHEQAGLRSGYLCRSLGPEPESGSGSRTGSRPLSPHMLLEGEHARRVIELLTNVLADALTLATASAVRVLRFVMNHSARKL